MKHTKETLVGKRELLSHDGSPVYSSGLVDEHGNSIMRTPRTHPYSYDGFVTWRGGQNTDVNGTSYSDRLWEHDYKKYNQLCKKYFGDEGQRFSNREASDIEKFLREFLDAPKLKLIFIMEYCNQSSGYPVWRFDYNTNK